jgi:SNF2 family DNA or RNA helicase
MSTKFFTNQDDNSLLIKFEGVFTHVQSIQFFDALVGYFRASGYFKVRPFLDKVQKVRILVGINVDKLTEEYHSKGQLYLSDANRTKDEFIKEVLENIQDADYDGATEKGILQFIDDLITGKIELRAHPDKKIHAKVYIFRPIEFNKHAPCEVITGSSNLTDAGLGTNPQSNYEFNVSLRDYDDVKFANDEFEKLWKESHPILQAEAESLRKLSYLADECTPYQLYIKLLIEYFGKRVEYDPYNIDLLLPDKYRRLKYQSDAANQGYAMMMKHNGLILADVVGLGKTIIAFMIAKKFVYENGTHTKMLIVYPPALESSWRKTANDFVLDNHIHFISNGSLHKVLNPDGHGNIYKSAEQYDLIIVDESHKFRNDYTERFEQLQKICKTRRSISSENSDTKKKVILVSATPLNNSPEDIENQIYLFQDPRNSTLDGVKNLQQFFKPLKDEYNRLRHETPLDIKKVKRIFEKIRDGVVEPLVIRRTRKDIENNQDYLEDLKEQRIDFPKIKGPEAIHYEFDNELSKLFYDTITALTRMDDKEHETEGIEYHRYRAIEYLRKKEHRDLYGEVESIAERLAAIMQTLMVKRLESSFFAFRQSLKRFQKATKNMIDWLESDKIPIAPDFNANEFLDEHSIEDLEEKMNEKGGNNRMFKAKDFKEDFLPKLKKDKAFIDNLVKRWDKVGDEDPKIDEFLKELKAKFLDPKKNPSGKLVIFTESKETASYLKKYLEQKKYSKILCVDASNRKTLQNIIAENFDANYDKEWKDDYSIIITTEVLAEGINLHRSNTILNYDVPWNSTRLMQRIGRVNRIGTKAKYIYVYNFYPTDDSENTIHLSDTALKKLQAFHTAFGEDNKIYSMLEEVGEGALYGTKIVEEESEIQKYLVELREFRDAHPKEFKNIQQLPLRARVGRNYDSVVQDEYPISGSTLTYLKSKDHPGVFYYVSKENTLDELSFIEAVKILKCAETEKRIPLHQQHHSHVQQCLEHFKEDVQVQKVETITRKSLSPAENKALSSIQLIIPMAPTAQKKAVLAKVLEVIKSGGIRGMAKEINNYFGSHSLKDKEQFMERLFLDVIDHYKITSEMSNDATTGYVLQKPYIVLSESFSE